VGLTLDLRAKLLPERSRSTAEAADERERTSAKRGGLRRELMLSWIHLAVLWAFAFAKPLFDVLADSPEFFVARGNTRADILLFSTALVLVPPSLMVAVELAGARLPRLRRALHLLFIAALCGAFALQVLDDAFGGSSELLLVAAAVLALAAVLAYARTPVAPAVLTVLAPVPVVFLLVFLLASDVSKLVLPQGDADSATAHVRSDTTVVLVVFDEFDSNMLMDARLRIDRTRYPNFASFADDATWYRNATTVDGGTTKAVPALLSGRRPSPDLLPIAADYPNSLFTLLGDSHSLDVTETATEVCPERLCGGRPHDPLLDRLGSLTEDLGIVSLHLLFPEGMRGSLPAVDQTFGDFAGGGRDSGPAASKADVPARALRNRTGQYEALLNGIARDRGGPTLHFVHTALPHIPWEYLPSGQQYLDNGLGTPDLQHAWGPDPFLPRMGLQRHLLQVGYVDRLVGRLMKALRQAGLYDRALVVITADHGVSYQANLSRRSPGSGNGSDIAGVPLLIKYPGQRRGHIDDSMVETIQIVPTIADRLGARLPWKADGRPIGDGTASGTVRVGDFTMSFSEFVRQRKARLRRMIRLFGADDGGARLYVNGPGADLLGRPVAPLTADLPARVRVELDSGELLDDVRPDARVAPSFVTGRVDGELAPGTPLALAVNGRVAGTTRSFERGGETRVAGFVPPDAFRAGSNTLELFAIEGSGVDRRLVRLETARPDDYRLVDDGGTARIAGAGGEARVQPGRVYGYVDLVERDDEGLRLVGWAVDGVGAEPVERVLAFQGERLVGQARPALARPDVVRRFKEPALARSGFDIRAIGRGVELDDLRVFGLSGNVAGELKLPRR
jgi:hypothetical protein